MKLHTIKSIGIILFLMISGLMFFGCGAPQKLTVVLDWTVNTNHTGIYAALKNGYFTDEGLDVAVIAPPETGAAGLLLSGKAEFGFSYQEEITMARSQGHPLVAIAAVLQHNTSGFASRKEAGILRPRDFEGKRYGGWGSPMEEAMIRALMKRDNGDFSKTRMLSIGSMDFFAATGGSVDYTWIFEGWDGVAARVKGIDINYIPLAAIEPALDYYTPVLAATGDFIEKNPGTVAKFLKAAARGYEWAVRNPDEAGALLFDYAPELDRDLVLASQRFLADKYIADAPRWGVMKESVWRDYAAWLKEYGLLEGPFVPEEAFTNEFLP